MNISNFNEWLQAKREEEHKNVIYLDCPSMGFYYEEDREQNDDEMEIEDDVFENVIEYIIYHSLDVTEWNYLDTG